MHLREAAAMAEARVAVERVATGVVEARAAVG
jgi:hypothetical protein